MRIVNRNLRISPPALRHFSAAGRSKSINLDDPAACLHSSVPYSRMSPAIPRAPSPSVIRIVGFGCGFLGTCGIIWSIPSRRTRPFSNTLGNACFNAVRCIGRCIYFLHLTPSLVAEIFESWGILRSPGITLNKWELVPHRGDLGEGPSGWNPSDLGARLNESWEIAARNIGRAR